MLLRWSKKVCLVGGSDRSRARGVICLFFSSCKSQACGQSRLRWKLPKVVTCGMLQEQKLWSIKWGMRPGAVAHACNPSTFGGWSGRITWGQEFKTSLTNIVKSCLYKNTKISQAWWQVPLIPDTQEPETGESLEPGRWRLQWAKNTPLPSSLGDRVKLCLKTEKQIL